MSTLPASDFGTLLRRHRRAANLTQEELAARAGVSVDTISALERGVSRAPHKDTIELLCDALRLAPEERARLEAARGRLAPEATPSREPSLHLVRDDEDQAPLEQPPTSSAAPASVTPLEERPSPPESAPPPDAAPPPARRQSKRVAMSLAALLVLLVGTYGGLSYGRHLWPFGAGAAATETPVPGYAYLPPTHKGGTITFSTVTFFSGDELSGTNPWFIQTFNANGVLNALWGFPYVTSPTGAFLPDELQEIPTLANGGISPDGRTITLRLRHDLQWSDGQPLTADDFLYWLEVFLDPAVGEYTGGFDQIVSPQASDPYTLVLHYKEFYVSALFVLPFAAPRHAWGSIPNKELRQHDEVSLYPNVTSGPFKIADKVPGQSITMVPNPYYHSTTLHNSVLKHLVYKAYSDVDSLIDGFEAGETDYAEGFSLDGPLTVSGIPGLRVSHLASYTQLDFNLTNEVLQNVQVRKAIEEAIDRCALIKQVFQPQCKSMLVDTILPPPSPSYDPTLKTYGYDLAQARRDMLIAGWDCASGMCIRNDQLFPSLTLVTTSGPASRKQATEFIKRSLLALGIPVTLKYYPVNPFFNDYLNGGILATGQFDLALFNFNFNLDDDGNLYSIYHSSQIPSSSNNGGSNYERISDPNIDDALDKAHMLPDLAGRVQLYKEIQRVLVQDVYLIPLFQALDLTLVNPTIGNQQNNPIGGPGQGNLWNISDWFVIKQG